MKRAKRANRARRKQVHVHRRRLYSKFKRMRSKKGGRKGLKTGVRARNVRYCYLYYNIYIFGWNLHFSVWCMWKSENVIWISWFFLGAHIIRKGACMYSNPNIYIFNRIYFVVKLDLIVYIRFWNEFDFVFVTC